jgi:hypothetical protein
MWVPKEPRRAIILIVAALGSIPAGTAWGQCEIRKLEASGAAEDAEFGFAVATDGNSAAVGAPRDDTRGQDAGAVHLFRRSGVNWVFQTRITAYDGTAYDSFGTAVAIKGDYLAVGAPAVDLVDQNVGAVYAYRRISGLWASPTKITVPDALADDEFGLSVALSEEYLAAGARTDEFGISSGSVYVFRRSGNAWVQEAKLTAADADAGDQFAISVALSGTVLVVGSRLDDDHGFDSGSAYVFRRVNGAWTLEAKLTAADAAEGDEFGVSVGVDGDYFIVGARQANIGANNNSGAVYIFRRDGAVWTQEAKLTATDAATNDQFGVSVGIAGNHAIVGAWQDADAGRNTGSAYAFERMGTSWTQMLKLREGIPASLDDFGFSVAIGGNFALTGIPGDDGVGARSGSANLYGVAGDCNRNGIADVCDILGGVALDRDNDGVPDDCPLWGDFDRDGDIDLRDLREFQNCFAGMSQPTLPACTVFDIEPDADVDTTDSRRLLPTISGP